MKVFVLLFAIVAASVAHDVIPDSLMDDVLGCLPGSGHDLESAVADCIVIPDKSGYPKCSKLVGCLAKTVGLVDGSYTPNKDKIYYLIREEMNHLGMDLDEDNMKKVVDGCLVTYEKELGEAGGNEDEILIVLTALAQCVIQGCVFT